MNLPSSRRPRQRPSVQEVSPSRKRQRSAPNHQRAWRVSLQARTRSLSHGGSAGPQSLATRRADEGAESIDTAGAGCPNKR
jgi:hypothetical protein